jgi:O-antigen/teichoic acid export membrane protein
MAGGPVGATAVMILLTLLAAAVNYASNLVFSRVLSPAAYGDLTALFALTVIVAVPCGAAQTVVADRLATYAHAGERASMAYLIRHAAAHVAVYALFLGALYVAAIPLIVDLLNLQGSGSAVALAPMLILSFFMPLAFGILQGLERFIALGLLMLWVATSRIALGVPWALSDLGGGPGGALLGTALGNIVALVAVAWLVREHVVGRGTGAARAGLRRRLDMRSLTAGAAFTGFAVLSNFDVILAKLLLDPQSSGEYAALATIEKIIFFLPGAVSLLMVPRAAKARLESGSAGGVLRLAALLVFGVTLLVAVPAAFAPSLVVETMFGAGYDDASAGVIPIAIAGAGLALLNLLVVYTVAIRDRRWLGLLLAGVGVQVAAIGVFHGSPTEVAIAQATTVWLVLILNEVLFHPLVRAGRRARTVPAG